MPIRAAAPVAAVLAYLTVGCSCRAEVFPPREPAAGSGAGASSSGAGGFSLPEPGPPAGSGGSRPIPNRPCVNLECQQTTCTMGGCAQRACQGGARTSLSGTVHDPAGKVPLYNVVVYVPNAPLAPMVTGASCENCTAVTGSPIASAITDATGEFKLDNVPVGSNIPLVIQVGKWRREVRIPFVAPCVDTRLADRELTRLPRNQREGNLPKIGLATGGADALECLLRKIGVDEAEFTPESGNGRVNLFAGFEGAAAYVSTLNGGASLPPATTLWNDVNTLRRYDVVMLDCEGSESETRKTKDAAALAAMAAYTNMGGRVFATHWHNHWLEDGPQPLPMVATFDHGSDLADPIVAQVETGFPKGAALAQWLVNVGASATAGQIAIQQGQNTVKATNPLLAQRWIYLTSPPSVQYLTFNAPLGAAPDKQCGRVVFTDIHLAAGDASGPPFPAGCTSAELLPQEKALEFMLFDLSSCVLPDDRPPVPPQVID
jgi:hypothetical protein